jgi:hypothetical protein
MEVEETKNDFADILGHVCNLLRFADTTCVCNVGLYYVNTPQLKVWADILPSKETFAELSKQDI